MQQTVATSSLLQHRITLVEERMGIMKEAILNKDFDSFAELTMRDSNQFHAVCLDTYPPISYLVLSSNHRMTNPLLSSHLFISITLFS
jgi:diphosphomevalonate decarboxylase